MDMDFQEFIEKEKIEQDCLELINETIIQKQAAKIKMECIIDYMVKTGYIVTDPELKEIKWMLERILLEN